MCYQVGDAIGLLGRAISIILISGDISTSMIPGTSKLILHFSLASGWGSISTYAATPSVTSGFEWKEFTWGYNFLALQETHTQPLQLPHFIGDILYLRSRQSRTLQQVRDVVEVQNAMNICRKDNWGLVIWWTCLTKMMCWAGDDP